MTASLFIQYGRNLELYCPVNIMSAYMKGFANIFLHCYCVLCINEKIRFYNFMLQCLRSWIIQLKTLTRFLLQLLISWFLGQTVKIQVTSHRNIWIWRSKELFRLNLWFVHKLKAALFSTWKMSKMFWVFYTSILFPYLKAKNSTPTPWLKQIRFTWISLTQLFKRFPFLT